MGAKVFHSGVEAEVSDQIRGRLRGLRYDVRRSDSSRSLSHEILTYRDLASSVNEVIDSRRWFTKLSVATWIRRDGAGDAT